MGSFLYSLLFFDLDGSEDLLCELQGHVRREGDARGDERGSGGVVSCVLERFLHYQFPFRGVGVTIGLVICAKKDRPCGLLLLFLVETRELFTEFIDSSLIQFDLSVDGLEYRLERLYGGILVVFQETFAASLE